MPFSLPIYSLLNDPLTFLRNLLISAPAILIALTPVSYTHLLALFGAAGQNDGADGFSAFMRTSCAT